MPKPNTRTISSLFSGSKGTLSLTEMFLKVILRSLGEIMLSFIFWQKKRKCWEILSKTIHLFWTALSFSIKAFAQQHPNPETPSSLKPFPTKKMLFHKTKNNRLQPNWPNRWMKSKRSWAAAMIQTQKLAIFTKLFTDLQKRIKINTKTVATWWTLKLLFQTTKKWFSEPKEHKNMIFQLFET